MQSNFINKFFLRYFFVIYYLYMMSVNVLIPRGSAFGAVIVIIFFLSVVSLSIQNKNVVKKYSYIYVYVGYVFISATLLSSDLMSSYTNLIKLSIGLLWLPLGYYLIPNIYHLKRFITTGLILVIMYVIYIALANIFNLGNFYGNYSDGAEGALQIGNVFADGLYTNVYVILGFSLLFLFHSKHLKKIVLVLALTAIITIVNMKRMPIALLGGGLFLYFGIAMFFKNKARLSIRIERNFILMFLGLFLIFSFFFYDYYVINRQARENRFDGTMTLEEEGRIVEFGYVLNETFLSDNLITLFFGRETGNYVGTYAGGRMGTRPMHNDYSKLINGGGVVGTIFWFAIQLSIIITLLKVRHRVKLKNQFDVSLYSLSLVFWVVYTTSMVSGVYECVMSSSYYYAFIGAVMRRYSRNNRIIKKTNENTNCRK